MEVFANRNRGIGMGGVETSRGIVYQNAQAALAALDVLTDPTLKSVRVEGTEDILDIEIFDVDGVLVSGHQVKTRDAARPWSKKPILDAILRWASLPDSGASFVFVTDGRLGPSAGALKSALESAVGGDLAVLADFLNLEGDDPSLERLASATVRQDASGAEAVLGIAERRVRSLLVGSRSPAEAERAAGEAVTRLWSELAIRSTNSDPAGRMMTDTEIAGVLGGVAGLKPEHRWSDFVRTQYLEKIYDSGADVYVVPVIEPDDPEAFSAGDPGPLRLLSLAPCLVSGRSGTGKTTALRILALSAAEHQRPVIVGHAEAYVPGRLADFVTDSIAAVTELDLPSATGAQALDDVEVVLVIDGVSEVPRSTQAALRDEISHRVAADRGARIILAGRDRASIRAALPTSISVNGFVIRPFDDVQLKALVTGKIDNLGRSGLDRVSGSDFDVELVVTAVLKGLGEAAGVPMLCSMAVDLLLEGVAIPDAAALFSATLQRIAATTGATNFDLAMSALGSMFATLLDSGRRYVNPHEYRTLLSDATNAVADAYFDVDLDQIRETVERCGLLSPLPGTQVLVPLHDSYADFLAARAHHLGFAEWPEALATGDELRIEFTANLGSLNASLTRKIASDIPFSVARLASCDVRDHDDGSSDELSQVMDLLIAGPPLGPFLWRSGDRVVATLVNGPGRWVDEAVGISAMNEGLSVVIPHGEGPLRTAARLWRLWLATTTSRPTGLPPSPSVTAEEAALAITKMAAERSRVVDGLLGELAPIQRELIREVIGDTGLVGVVLGDATDFGDSLTIVYRSSKSIDVRTTAEAREVVLSEYRDSEDGYTESTVRGYLSRSPESLAQSEVRGAIEALTEHGWLA